MDGDLLLLASSKVINELRFCACGERCSESWLSCSGMMWVGVMVGDDVVDVELMDVVSVEIGCDRVVIRCGVVWCGVVWCGVVWCGVVV